MCNSSGYALEVTGLRFSRSERRIRASDDAVVLQDISFAVRKGECVALMGKSGVGKSTLLSLVSGLLLPRARLGHHGTIRIAGSVVTDTAREVHVAPHRRNVGVAFQKGIGLQEQRTVAENIQYPLRVQGKRFDESDRQDLVRTFALWSAEDYSDTEDAEDAERRFWASRINRLSGGQQQRVALARCFARRDRAMYLLDEPLDGQDNPLRQQLIVNLRKLIQNQQSAGCLIVTHRMAEAFSLAQRIVYFDTDSDGFVRVVAEGAPADLYDRPPHVSVARFLGDPAMNVIDAGVLNSDRVPPGEYFKLEALRKKQAIALLRPEQVAFGASASTCDFSHPAAVTDERRNGAERVLRVQLNGGLAAPFHLIVPKSGEFVENTMVGWNWDQLHFFRQPSGERL